MEGTRNIIVTGACHTPTVRIRVFPGWRTFLSTLPEKFENGLLRSEILILGGRKMKPKKLLAQSQLNGKNGKKKHIGKAGKSRLETGAEKAVRERKEVLRKLLEIQNKQIEKL